jgi:hypothetical protein
MGRILFLLVFVVVSASTPELQACRICCLEYTKGVWAMGCCAQEQSGPSHCLITIGPAGPESCETFGYCEYVKVLAPKRPPVAPETQV